MEESDTWWYRSGQLSILYLRCMELINWVLNAKVKDIPFNSLFEMHAIRLLLERLGDRTSFQFSI